MAVGEKASSQKRWIFADIEQPMEDLKALRRKLCLVMASRQDKGSRRRRTGRRLIKLTGRQRIAASRPSLQNRSHTLSRRGCYLSFYWYLAPFKHGSAPCLRCQLDASPRQKRAYGGGVVTTIRLRLLRCSGLWYSRAKLN